MDFYTFNSTQFNFELFNLTKFKKKKEEIWNYWTNR